MQAAPSPRPGLRWLLVSIALGMAIALAWLGNRLPDPAPQTAPDAQFSAMRAMQDVRAIATKPHPIGSPEIEETRRYLVRRMAELGLAPDVRLQTAVVTRRASADAAIGGRVRNIVGVLKGSDPALPAALLMAHYDTAPLSPGAGDDTAGIAVALEVARALKAAGPLRRSVIFLFTDGEEAGLLGANAFFESDPLRHRVGVVVNLEARGDSGRALMFQTSPGNRALIEAYRRNVGSPAADSLMVTIYKQMPNDTDLTAALEHNHAGMNFAFVGHQMAYHTPLSTPDSLNAGSVQHMGDQVLPLMRDLALAKNFSGSGDDMIFADLFGLTLVAYASWLGWLSTMLVVGTTFAIAGIAVARRAADWRDLIAGAGGMLALLFGIATTLTLALRLVALMLRDIASPYAVVGQIGWLLPAVVLIGFGTGALLVHAARQGWRWRAGLALAIAGMIAATLGEFSVVPLVSGTVAALFALASMGRRAAPAGWFAGALLLLALLALLLQIFLPNGAHALIWPLLLLAPVAALLLFAPARAERPAGLAAMLLAGAFVAGLAARSGYDFFVLIGLSMPAAMAPFMLLAIVALTPLLVRAPGLRGVGLLCVAAGLALSAAAGIKGRTPSDASPEMVEAFYIADPADGSARWAAARLDTSGWVKAVLAQDGATREYRSVAPLAKEKLWVAAARPAPFIRPEFSVDATDGGRSPQLAIRARNANGGRYMRIFVKPSTDLSAIRLMDRPVAGRLKAGIWSQVIFHASGTDEVTLAVTAAGPGKLEARMVEVRDGLPAASKAIALPRHVIPYRRAGNSMITTRTEAQW